MLVGTHDRRKWNGKEDSDAYHESVQNPNRDPKATPQGVDNRDQRVARLKPVETCYELRKTAEDSYEGKEDGGRLWTAPPIRNVAARDERRARESREP